MLVALIVVLIISAFLLIACLALRGPLARAMDAKHGLTDTRSALTEIRTARMKEQTLAVELTVKVNELKSQLDKIKSELKTVNEQVAVLPKQPIEIIFEVGAPDAGMLSFDFMISRPRTPTTTGNPNRSELELWSQPRRARAWARNRVSAEATLQTRFPPPDGYVLRIAGDASAAKPVSLAAS
jgi:hypothetical protein